MNKKITYLILNLENANIKQVKDIIDRIRFRLLDESIMLFGSEKNRQLFKEALNTDSLKCHVDDVSQSNSVLGLMYCVESEDSVIIITKEDDSYLHYNLMTVLEFLDKNHVSIFPVKDKNHV